jgi:hypothetical protein
MAMMFAMFRFSTAAVLMLAACGPETPRRAASDAVVADAEDAGAAWPLLLQHCLTLPACDPMSDFGTGVNEASGHAGSTAWHAQTEDRVAEGGQDYGASIVLAIYGQRGGGGRGGRPLTIDELPDNLGGRKAKRTTLAIEYRMPAERPEVYGLQFISPFLTGLDADVDEATLEIVGQAGVLISATAGGMEPPATPVNGNYKAPKTMVFFVSQNLRDEPAAKLLAALQAGETLSIRLAGSDGRLVLQDTLYTDGFTSALELAAGSLQDAEIARPIAERCARFASEPLEKWKLLDVTPALMVCDPRVPEMRR